MTLRRLGGMVVLAALLAMVPAPPDASAQDADDDPDAVLAAITALLGQRSAAMSAGDLAAVAATVDPGSPAAVEADGWAAAGFVALGLDGYDESLAVPTALVDLAPPGLAGRLGAPAVVVEVHRRHRVAGLDAVDALDRRYVTFVRRSAGWRMAGDDDLRPVGRDSDRVLWDVGPVRTHRGEGVLVVAAATVPEARARQLLSLTIEARASLVEPWSDAAPPGVVVLLPADAGQVEAVLQPSYQLGPFTAFTTYGVDRRRGWDPTSPRVLAQEGNLAQRSLGAQRRILAHELVHHATVGLGGPSTPLWVHEGLAEHVTRGPSALTPEPGTDLPGSADFRAGTTAEIVDTYALAHSAIGRVGELAAGAGVSTTDVALVNFFTRLGAVAAGPGTVNFHLDTALTATVGVDLAGFVAAWSGADGGEAGAAGETIN